jgi:hypothetical protein
VTGLDQSDGHRGGDTAVEKNPHARELETAGSMRSCPTSLRA